MPKRGAFALGLTALALALLLNFQTPERSDDPGAHDRIRIVPDDQHDRVRSSSGSSGTSGSASTSGSRAHRARRAPIQATAAPAAGNQTVSGPTVGTRYGPVQVSVTIEGGQIADVTALQLPSGGRSGQISSIVEPRLRSQALSAQSANIDGVSGATYTSEAYAQSLQAALDDAGLRRLTAARRWRSRGRPGA